MRAFMIFAVGALAACGPTPYQMRATAEDQAFEARMARDRAEYPAKIKAIEAKQIAEMKSDPFDNPTALGAGPAMQRISAGIGPFDAITAADIAQDKKDRAAQAAALKAAPAQKIKILGDAPVAIAAEALSRDSSGGYCTRGLSP